MPTNDFKPFATAGGANVSTQAEYLALAALSTGWQSGKASSKEVNKAVRQATFIAAAVAQFIADKGGVDVLDDGDLAGVGTKLITAMNKTSQPLDATLTALAALVGAANKLPYFSGADTAALTDLTQVGRDIIGKSDIAAVLTYLGLQSVVYQTRKVNGQALDKDINIPASDTGALAINNNLADLGNVGVAVSNLGLNDVVRNTRKVNGQTLDKDIVIPASSTGALSINNNLSDLQSTSTAVSNLGLNNVVRNTRQINGHALSSDVNISAADTSALAINNNLSDVGNKATARQNLNVPQGTDPQLPKAWCRFNGKSGAIVSHSNISSITKNGTGLYDVTFLKNMANTGYSVIGSAINPASPDVSWVARIFGSLTRTASAFNVTIIDNNVDQYADAEVIDLCVFGDLS